MPTLECLRALAEPPTCTHPQQIGELRFRVFGPEYDTNVGAWAECTEKTCDCDLTPAEWDALERQAVAVAMEGDGDLEMDKPLA